MNKKELTRKLMNRMQNFGYFPSFTNVKTFIQEYEKLTKSEPQKPVVPQFVAEWYEKHKNSLEFNIFDYVYRFDKKEESDLKNWFNDINTTPFQTLVNMHQFGYTVEEEKQYEVILCNGQSLKTVYRQGSDHFDFEMVYGTPENFTKKQLEDAGFGWVFDCEGMEVEEVE